MRMIRQYRFESGRKIGFAQWPEIVHLFLEENGLTYGRFMYCFEHLVHEDGGMPKPLKRLLKDCPALGEARYRDQSAQGLGVSCWLSNIDQEDSFPEEHLLPLISKIQRGYALHDSRLYYYDVDFFGSIVPFERNYACAEEFSRKWECPYDPTEGIADQPTGSGFTLHRDFVNGQQALIMTIDVLRNGRVLDAATYCQAMRKLMPGVKIKESIKIVLTAEERQRIAMAETAAGPTMEICREYLKQRLPGRLPHRVQAADYSVASACRMLEKKFGYKYRLEWRSGYYMLQRRTPRGNALCIDLDSGPSHLNTGMEIHYRGPGFSCYLGAADHTPENQEELETALVTSMQVVAAFGETLLPQLDAFYPEAPAGFEADMF